MIANVQEYETKETSLFEAHEKYIDVQYIVSGEEVVEVTDISKTSGCPLARVMRKELRERGIRHLKVLFSTEDPLPGGWHRVIVRAEPGTDTREKAAAIIA